MSTDDEAELARAQARVRATGHTDRSAWAAQWAAERNVAKAEGGAWAEALDDVPRWDGGAPLPQLVCGEHVCVLVCRADDPDPSWDGTYVTIVSPEDTTPSPLLVWTFAGFHSIKFGGPNDEAMHGHPLFGRGLVPYGAHIVHNSPWIAEQEQINSVHPYHRPETYRSLRHYLFAFHDQTFEALARDVDVRRVTSTIAAQLQEAVLAITSHAS